MLEISDLHVAVNGTSILNGVDLRVDAGEVHAIMGPNGSGKSTLAGVIAGRESFEVCRGTIRYDGIDLLSLEPEERAHRGVFLAFQYPVEIPGVTNMEFLKAAVDAIRQANGDEALSAVDFMKRARATAQALELPPEFLKRGVNEGFSGGEKKRNEIVQLMMLEPRLAVLDETDSGLDIDALQVVAKGVNSLRADDRAMILVTHYQRLLDHIVPDFVHVLSGGRIVRSGGSELALELEERGYGWLENAS
ncbi:MAG: Fe-S cluster assembly ATPase SufC [Pseudomonadales bacterium]